MNGSPNFRRLGLDESLEAYAARIERTPDEARHLWRMGGLAALFTPKARTNAHVDALERGLSGCRIAPGVAVPTIQVTWTEDAP